MDLYAWNVNRDIFFFARVLHGELTRAVFTSFLTRISLETSGTQAETLKLHQAARSIDQLNFLAPRNDRSIDCRRWYRLEIEARVQQRNQSCSRNFLPASIQEIIRTNTSRYYVSCI